MWFGLLLLSVQLPVFAGQADAAGKHLRFGVLPDSARDFIEARYAPLLQYI